MIRCWHHHSGRRFFCRRNFDDKRNVDRCGGANILSSENEENEKVSFHNIEGFDDRKRRPNHPNHFDGDDNTRRNDHPDRDECDSDTQVNNMPTLASSITTGMIWRRWKQRK